MIELTMQAIGWMAVISTAILLFFFNDSTFIYYKGTLTIKTPVKDKSVYKNKAIDTDSPNKHQ